VDNQTWKIKQDIERYGPNLRSAKKFPLEFQVLGLTREQAEDIASTMSFDEPGCTDYFFVVEQEEVNA